MKSAKSAVKIPRLGLSEIGGETILSKPAVYQNRLIAVADSYREVFEAVLNS